MIKKAVTLCMTLALGLCLIPTVSTAAPPVQQVTVINPTSVPVPVKDLDNPALQPFQWFFSITFDPTQGTNGQSFTVPAGKRLVIEFVSATVALERGLLVDAVVTTTVNGIEGKHHFIPTMVGAAWGFQYSYLISMETRLYADPGTKVEFALTDNYTGNGGSWGTISGYLVNLP
jgi:hypothetical protein